MVSQDFQKQLEGYGLTTATITYRKPGAVWLINPNPLIRQFYDVFPDFPELHRYLEFWKKEIEGPLYSVVVAHAKLIKPAEIKAIGREFRLH